MNNTVDFGFDVFSGYLTPLLLIGDKALRVTTSGFEIWEQIGHGTKYRTHCIKRCRTKLMAAISAPKPDQWHITEL